MKHLALTVVLFAAISANAEYIPGFGDPDTMTWAEKVKAYRSACHRVNVHNKRIPANAASSVAGLRKENEPTAAQVNDYVESVVTEYNENKATEEANRKFIWMAAHKGATDAQYDAWTKMSIDDRVNWQRKWLYEHKNVEPVQVIK